MKTLHGADIELVKVSELIEGGMVLGFALLIMALATPVHVAAGAANLNRKGNEALTEAEPEMEVGADTNHGKLIAVIPRQVELPEKLTPVIWKRPLLSVHVQSLLQGIGIPATVKATGPVKCTTPFDTQAEPFQICQLEANVGEAASALTAPSTARAMDLILTMTFSPLLNR